MKLAKFLAFTLGAAVMLSSCRNNDSDDDVTPGNGDNVLTGNITSSKRLTKDKVWILKGYVKVTNNAELTIDAGTVIKSDITEKGALIILPGSKLWANGTATEPVVFTSGQAAGNRKPGDWGGIVLLGNATTNRTTRPTIEGGIGEEYGGTNDEDNSGSLTYVRIEYAGIAAEPNSEINGLTCGAVGRGTKLEHIMVSHANDDAYEFFGGTVNAKWLVAYSTADDDYDFDFGYRGTIQFAVAQRVPTAFDPNDASNGIECDNDGNGTAATPATHPVLSNLTLIGPNSGANTGATHNYGNRWRRATQFTLINSIVMGHQKGGVGVESPASFTAFMNGTSEFKNNLVHAVVKPFTTDSATARVNTTGHPNPATPEQTTVMIADAASKLQVKAEENGCQVFTDATLIGLTAPFNFTAPNFLAIAGQPASQGTFVTKPGLTPVTYRGAFGTENWMQGWTNFNAQNANY